MKQYNHNKLELANAIAKNLSIAAKEPIYVQVSGIKSVPTMKYVDTTVIQVFRHSELPNPSSTGMIKTVFYKGKKLPIQ